MNILKIKAVCKSHAVITSHFEAHSDFYFLIKITFTCMLSWEHPFSPCVAIYFLFTLLSLYLLVERNFKYHF